MTFSEYSRFTLSDIRISEMFIINNFCIFPLRDLGVEIQKGLYRNVAMRDIFLPYMYYSEFEQRRDCAKYITSEVVKEELFDIPGRSSKPLLHRVYTEVRQRNFYWKQIIDIPVIVTLCIVEMLINQKRTFFGE